MHDSQIAINCPIYLEDAQRPQNYLACCHKGRYLEPEIAFGVVLRKLRKERGLSQETLAFEAGIERNYISLLELGRNSASVKMLFKLAPALGVSVSDLMEKVESYLATCPTRSAPN